MLVLPRDLGAAGGAPHPLPALPAEALVRGALFFRYLALRRRVERLERDHAELQTRFGKMARLVLADRKVEMAMVDNMRRDGVSVPEYPDPAGIDPTASSG